MNGHWILEDLVSLQVSGVQVFLDPDGMPLHGHKTEAMTHLSTKTLGQGKTTGADHFCISCFAKMYRSLS